VIAASALLLDLTNPDLNTLAAALNGSMLRMGGSPVDFLVYEVSPDACSAANLNLTQKTWPTGYFCPIWKQAPGQCLTMARWQQLLEFAGRNGLHAVFDLNACWNRSSASAEVTWTQIDGLLRYTAAAPWAQSGVLAGFEFGNEVYDNVAPARYAADINHIYGLIQQYWPSAEGRPVLMGPDDSMILRYRWSYTGDCLICCLCSANDWNTMLGGLQPGALHAVTVHLYGAN
jgi:hypothetical protein